MDNVNALLRDLPRGHYAGHIGEMPGAYFESPDDIAATESLRFEPTENRDAKLFLGVVNGEINHGHRLPDGRVPKWVQGGVPIGIASDQHALVCAGSRAGKARSSVFCNLLALPNTTSIFALDPKGEHARTTAEYRARVLQQDVAVTDAFDCSGLASSKWGRGFNAIEFLLNSDHRFFIPNAKLIAESLVLEQEGTKDPHWSECAKQAIAMLCVHVASHANYEGRRDLVTVWQLASQLATPYSEDSNQYWLEREMAASDAAGGFVSVESRAFYDRTGGEFSSVLSNVRRQLAFIGIECIQETLRGPSVDPRKLKSGSIAWYVATPAMRDAELRGWKRMVLQLALAACEEEANQQGDATLFLLEEFSSLQKLSCVETAIAQFAGIGVKLQIILQDLSQLKAVYPHSWETFLANSGIAQFFGGNDYTTLSYCSKRLGEALVVSHTSNQPGRDQTIREAATGASWSVTNKPLLTPDEIERLFARDDRLLRQLVFCNGRRPMVLQRAFYDKSEYFTPKLNRSFFHDPTNC